MTTRLPNAKIPKKSRCTQDQVMRKSAGRNGAGGGGGGGTKPGAAPASAGCTTMREESSSSDSSGAGRASSGAGRDSSGGGGFEGSSNGLIWIAGRLSSWIAGAASRSKARRRQGEEAARGGL